MRLRRSCLVVPASSTKMLAKAAGLDADEVVIDLEDGVAVAEKEAARANLASASARGTLAAPINGVPPAPWPPPVRPIGGGAAECAVGRIAGAGRAYGLQPVDGPYAVLGDRAGLMAGAKLALAHGYDGKWVIHPDQIGPVNEAFTPSPEEVERARA